MYTRVYVFSVLDDMLEMCSISTAVPLLCMCAYIYMYIIHANKPVNLKICVHT